MKILNVAEKNDAAKNIAAMLSRGTAKTRQGYSKYNKIYEFDHNVFGAHCMMIMTSVSGHLLNYDFSSAFRAWTSCNPVYLFDAPIVKYCPKEYEDIKRTLEREVRSCSKLIIWTDCDKEGENIGFEVIEVCTAVKQNISIYRAKFSEITPASVNRALSTLEKPNEKINAAVNVRRELDLRIGAAFTRFQTLHLKIAFPDALSDSLISYGSCQFPTLGFVVERFRAIADFISEQFWKIDGYTFVYHGTQSIMEYSEDQLSSRQFKDIEKFIHQKNDLIVEFTWERSKLFHKLACEVIYDMCKESGIATVQSVESKPKTKWRPRPLDTVELEKLASRKLHITAKETMKIAEKLYTLGYISYPRTETNIFPKEMNLVPIVQNFVQDPNWGDFANRILQEGPNPFQGNKSDQAHPPIHPIKYTAQLAGNERKVYDLIVRHFLACLSKHAEGLETTVKINIAGEKLKSEILKENISFDIILQFTGKGLMIIARNYLDIYPFDKWSDKEIHEYKEGEQFLPNIEMTEGETSPPSLLTEADLIALMEKHGIGTDATHAEHIETIKARLYVGLSDKYFVPRTLGMGLVEGYDSMGFEMSKPHLRAKLEEDLNRICEGLKNRDDVLSIHLQKYKEVFQSATSQIEKLNTAIEKYLNVQAQEGTQSFTEHGHIEKVKPCSKCNLDMIMRTKKSDEGKYVSCTGFPQCREAVFFPSLVQNVSVTSDACPVCGPQVFLLKFKFERGSCFLPVNYVGCIGGCDACLNSVLKIHSDGHAMRNSETPSSEANNPTVGNQFSCDSGYGSVESISMNRELDSDNLQINCNCGKKAISLTVKKQGPNCGKQFYSCSDRSCDFFQWIASGNSYNSAPPGTLQRTFPTNPTVRGGFQGSEDSCDVINCFCGQACKRCEVYKDGPNKGRIFFSCSKQFSDQSRCSFFKWDDSSGTGGNSARDHSFHLQNRNNSYNGYGKQQGVNQPRKRKCGLCGQEGHNRKNCSAANKRF